MKKKFLLFYERLSREDGDDESCSITNQRRLLNRFKEEHSEFHDYQVEEFIDDERIIERYEIILVSYSITMHILTKGR